MNLYLALERTTNMHVVVRRIDESKSQHIGSPDYDALNLMFKARNIEQLLMALEALGPLYSLDDSRLTTAVANRSSIAGIRKSLRSPNPDLLLGECYFDPFSNKGELEGSFTESGRKPVAATRRAATERSINHLWPELEISQRSVLSIEPLHDWLLMRNLFSIVMRLGALACDQSCKPSILDKAGFQVVEPGSKTAHKAMGKTSHIIPIAYNPFFSRPKVDLTWNDKRIWPFLTSITEQERSALDSALGLVGTRHLIGSPSVRVLTSVEADQEPKSLRLKAKHTQGGPATWIFLALESEEGGSQIETANALLRSLDRLFDEHELSFTGVSGDEISSVSDPRSLPEAVWQIVSNHPMHSLTTCKFCNRSFFSPDKGGEASFCGPSCRSAYSKMQRA